MLVHLAARAVGEHVRVRVGRFFASPDRKEQSVVHQLWVALGVNRPAGGVHGNEPVPDPTRADVRRDLLQRITPDAGQTERLLHREWPIHQARFGAHKRAPHRSRVPRRTRKAHSTAATPPPEIYDLER